MRFKGYFIARQTRAIVTEGVEWELELGLIRAKVWVNLEGGLIYLDPHNSQSDSAQTRLSN